MKQANLPLRLGLLLTTLFLIIAIFGPQLAPQDPFRRFSDVLTINGNIYIPSVRPIPPFLLSLFPLGTDPDGRDIFSRLLWAVRPTLLTCFGVVLARLFLGLPLGMLAGWFHGRTPERLLDALISSLISIPPLILALSLIALSPSRPLSIFILVLGLIGWPDIALFVKNQTLITRQAGYIESARALGASSPQILRRHVLPQLWPTLPIILAFELSAVLLLMAELGFLGVYIGNGFTVYAADPNSAGVLAVALTADTPELGQMLSDFLRKVLLAPWEMAAAAAVIALQVFAFNLLGEGLRRRADITR